MLEMATAQLYKDNQATAQGLMSWAYNWQLQMDPQILNPSFYAALYGLTGDSNYQAQANWFNEGIGDGRQGSATFLASDCGAPKDTAAFTIMYDYIMSGPNGRWTTTYTDCKTP